MVHFSRKTEYALLSLEYMAQKLGQELEISSTREISESFHIPYPLLSKVLQRLAAKGFIKAVYGLNGGYVLVKKPKDISVMDVAQLFEGSFGVVDCLKDEKITCPQWKDCSIKNPLYELNHKIYHLLSQTKLSDLRAGVSA